MCDHHGGGESKISGYRIFTQGNPRDNQPEKRHHTLLLEIDSDTEEMMFGDSGVAHICIDPEDLKNENLEKS